MNIHFALYDPSYVTGTGSYWTWHSEQIPLSMLQGVYYDYLVNVKPNNPNELGLSDFCGGFISLDSWVMAYRFFNGGRDLHGRLGRFVILTAWIPRGEAYDKSLLTLLQGSDFQNLALNIPSCPVEKMDLLSQKKTEGYLIVNPNTVGVQSLKNESDYLYPKDTLPRVAIQDFFALNDMQNYHLHIELNQINTAIKINQLVSPKKGSPSQNTVSTAISKSSAPHMVDQPYITDKSSATIRQTKISTGSPVLRANVKKFKWLFFDYQSSLTIVMAMILVILVSAILIRKPVTWPVHISSWNMRLERENEIDKELKILTEKQEPLKRNIEEYGRKNWFSQLWQDISDWWNCEPSVQEKLLSLQKIEEQKKDLINEKNHLTAPSKK